MESGVLCIDIIGNSPRHPLHLAEASISEAVSRTNLCLFGVYQLHQLIRKWWSLCDSKTGGTHRPHRVFQSP